MGVMAEDNAITAMRLQQLNCDNRNITQLRNSHNRDMEIAEIRRGLEKPGKSQRGLAKAMGIEASAVSRLLKGERKLQLHEVQKVQAYLSESSPESTQPARENSSSESIISNVAFPGEAKAEGALSSRLPVLGMAECGADGWSLWNGDVIDHVPMPSNLKGVKGAYAVFIAGDSMAPRYRAGEVAHIHPHKPVTPGSYVLVQKRPKAAGEPPMAVIKELVRRSGSKVVLAQYNPEKHFEIKTDDIVSMHRVVGSAEY